MDIVTFIFCTQNVLFEMTENEFKKRLGWLILKQRAPCKDTFNLGCRTLSTKHRFFQISEYSDRRENLCHLSLTQDCLKSAKSGLSIVANTAVVVAQLVERSLPISQVHGLNRVILQKFILNIYCQLCWKDKNKETEGGNGPFLKIKQSSAYWVLRPIYWLPSSI